jgi:hypothetical protein
MLGVGKFGHTDFLAILKWKQGERSALSTFRRGPNRLHVLFEMPPAGDYDHDKQRPLTPTEHIKLFGRRLRESWGTRIAFVDAGCIDDDAHKAGFPRHPLSELLERAKLAGARACPAVSLTHSDGYRKAVRRFVEWNSELPVCIRVDAASFDSATFTADLESMLRDISCRPNRCFLVLDFKAMEAPTGEALQEFVELLADRIADLPHLHAWLGLAFALSSFPASIKLKAGDIKEYERTDLALYEKLILNPKSLLRTPMYGDYGLDTSPIQKPQRRTPSAHLRYSTPKIYAVAKGTSVKKPNGYEAIFPVADLLTAQPYFAGADYSEGDAYISGLQKRTSSKGNAASWRWASSDHHLTSNAEAIGRLYGLTQTTSAKTTDAPPLQGDLFESSPETVPDDETSNR